MIVRAAPLSLHKASTKLRLRARRHPEDLDALILDLLARSNRPISAYDISDRSIAAGQPVVPNQVYRTLARLIDQGLVHRVESLSAYMLRQQSFDGCLVCDHCHAVQLLTDPIVVAGLKDRAERFGFAVDRTVVELRGLCTDCAADSRTAGDHEAARPLPTASPSPICGV
ncbi:MAG: transcriptional repressor [Sphingobium sp.]|nr:MAG: transcriptional repressor [Sphingobium sp.]